MIKICNYGCGGEAKHQFKNGKWCCSPHYLQCNISRQKRSGNKNSFFGRKHTSETITKLKKITRNQKDFPGRPSLTVRELKEKYPFFIKIEKVKEEFESGRILVRCKNYKCVNSEENNGWFIPTYIQLYERIRNVEKGNGVGNYLYCSEECKETCPCYKLKTDPLQLNKFHQYHRKVQKFTYMTLKHNSDKILNIELRGRKYGYNLDHKFSIIDGFNNDIDPCLVGHWRNLQIIKASDNRAKWMNSSITIKEIQKIEELFND